jgi:hypothetical protein
MVHCTIGIYIRLSHGVKGVNAEANCCRPSARRQATLVQPCSHHHRHIKTKPPVAGQSGFFEGTKGMKQWR